MYPTEQHDGWFERQLFSLEEYRTGSGLALADKRAIHDLSDLWKIALIQNTLAPSQDLLYSSLVYSPEAAKHYFDEEKQWIRDEFYYLGISLGRKPTSQEKEQDFEKQRTHIRFRLFYALKWPEDTQIREHCNAQESCIIHAFFTRAGEISFRDYTGQYFLSSKNRERTQGGAPHEGEVRDLRLRVA